MSKSTNYDMHRYIYDGTRLLKDVYFVELDNGSLVQNTLYFFYDNAGYPYALKYNGTTYYYITNLQGDVMGMVNSSGTSVASYTYDPYGKVLTATGSMAEINPLRYRGYYYDTETGFYYLQSRYYDPAIGRFINADSYASTGQGFIGYNMFAYCGNNPVNLSDPTGEFGLFSAIGVGVGALVGAAISAVDCLISSNGNASVTDLLIAAGVGAASGAMAALGPGGTAVASVITGVYAACTTDGPWYQKVAAGATAATLTYIAGGKAYAWGELLSNTSGMTASVYAFGTACVNFVTGISADLVSLGTQKAINQIVQKNTTKSTSTNQATAAARGSAAIRSKPQGSYGRLYMTVCLN